MKAKTIIALIFATIVVICSIQNVELTDVDFLFWKLSMSRVLIILGIFGIGVLVGKLVSINRKLILSQKK